MNNEESKQEISLEYILRRDIKFHRKWWNINNQFDCNSKFFSMVLSVALPPIILGIYFFDSNTNSGSNIFTFIGLAFSSIAVGLDIINIYYKFKVKAEYHLKKNTEYEGMLYQYLNKFISEKEAWDLYSICKRVIEP